MNHILKIFIFLALFLSLSKSSVAALVLKTKGKKVLIHLEGLKVKKGAYFLAIDPYGRKRGLLKIKQVGETKALGSLKYGHVSKNWALKLESKSRAIAFRKAMRRKDRRIASAKRKAARIAERRLARVKQKRKRHNRRRRIASYEEGEEYALQEFSKNKTSSNEWEESPDYQSQDILSNVSGESNLFDLSGKKTEEPAIPQDSKAMETVSEKLGKDLFLSITGRSEYNFMKVKPPGTKRNYTMTSYKGFVGFLGLDLYLNHFLRMEGALGYKKFFVSATEKTCGKSGGCSMGINYVTGHLGLKLNLLEFNDSKLWIALEGSLMYPLEYINDVLKEESFFPLHGTLGLGIGADFMIRKNIIIPISLKAAIYMPPSETIPMAGIGGLQLGLTYKF